MNNYLTKATEFAKRKIGPVSARSIGYTAVAMAFAVPVMADGPQARTMINSIVATIAQIGQYVGAALLAQGIFQLVMAFKDDNPDSKSKAIMFIMSAILLFGMKSILQGLVGDYIGQSLI